MSSTINYNQQPLLIIVVVACLGIYCSHYLLDYSLLILFINLLLFTAIWFIKSPMLKSVVIGLLYFGLFILIGIQCERRYHNNLVSNLNQSVIIVDGKVLTQPETLKSGYGWTSKIKINHVDVGDLTINMNGKVKLYSYCQNQPEFDVGDRIMIKGLFKQFSSPKNPGQFDYSTYMQQQGILGQLITNQSEDVQLIGKSSNSQFIDLLTKLQHNIGQRIKLCFPRDSQPWLFALLLGDRSKIDPLKRQLISLSGLAHVLAISGLHLTIIFFFVLSCIRVFPIAALFSRLVALTMIIMMTCLINGPVSALRALIMLGCSILIWFQIGKKDAWSAWALAGLVIILVNPIVVYQAGFQLSFMATAAILATWPYLPKIKMKLLQWIVHLVILSLAIFILTVGLTVFHFNMITPISIVTNLVAVPLLAFCLILSWSAIIVSLINTGWATTIGDVTGWFVLGLEQLAIITSQFPLGHFFIRHPPAMVLIILYSLLVLVKLVPGMVHLKGTIIGGWLLGLVIGMVIDQPIANITITALACDKGESFLIQGQNKNILIDTGTQSDFLYQVWPYIKYMGINQLDAVLITHEDADHSGGLEACLKLMVVNNCLFAGTWMINDVELMQLAGKRGVNLVELYKDKQLMVAPEIRISSLWPKHPGLPSNNNTCLVTEITILNQRLLFTGDSPIWIEKQWTDLKPCLLLKAGHHGDHKSTGSRLLQRLSPEAVMVSAGLRNSYGLPDPRMLRRVEQEQCLVFNTYRHGAVKINIDTKKIVSWQFWE